MANPTPTINQINAFNATQGTTIDFNIIGGTELVRSNRIYIYDLSDNSLICTHLYVSTESIHELPANTDSSIVYESGKSSADFINGAQYYAQIQTYTDTAGTQGGSGLSVAKMFWCLVDPTLTITTIPSTISTTSYNVSATYDANTSVVSNIIQQYQFSLYSATGSLLQSSGVVVGSGTQQGTSTAYDISYNFTGLSVGSSYYVIVDVTTTQGMSISTQSNTFTVSIDTPTLGEATVVNNACDGYISVTSNLSGEYGGSGSGEIVSFETDSENVFTKLEVALEPQQDGTPWIGTETDNTPYLHRAMPEQSNDYNRESLNQIVGGTVAWNQLVQITNVQKTDRGITATIDAITGVITLSGTSTTTFAAVFDPFGAVNGHIYIRTYKILTNPNGVTVRPHAFNINWSGANEMVISDSTLSTSSGISGFAANTSLDGITMFANIFDITAMFGSTIADYIYNLERATAGAGVAWFKKLFPKPYYAYNAGELMSVQAASHDMVGFNLFDKDTAVVFNAYLQNWSAGVYRWTQISDSRSFAIRCLPNTTYCAYLNGLTPQILRLCSIAEENLPTNPTGGGWYIPCDGEAITSSNGICTYTTGANSKWLIVQISSQFVTDGRAYDNLCVNLSWDGERDGEYESYVKHTYPLDPDLVLRGIPKLDSSNNLYFDGDEYESDGTVTRKYGVVDLGTLNWNYNSTRGVFVSDMISTAKQSGLFVCPKYIYDVGAYQSGHDKSGFIGYEGWFNRSIVLRDESYGSDGTVFKASLNGIYAVYELATPTTETADPYTNPQIVDPDGTEEFITDSIVPVGHESTYSLVCPIYGHDDVTVEMRGKNLFNQNIFLNATGWTEEDGAYHGLNTKLYNEYPISFPVDMLPYNGQLTFSFDYHNANVSYRSGYLYFRYTDGTESYKELKSADWTHITFTSTQGKTVKGILIGVSNTLEIYLKNVQLELGSAETEYEPYQGQTYTADLPQTVYGGTVDLVSGEMVIDRAMVDLGTLTYTRTQYNSQFYYFRAVFPSIAYGTSGQMANMICSNYETVITGTGNLERTGTITNFATNNLVLVRDDRYTDIQSFTSAVNGVQLVYELATPQEIQLTPQQIQTLVGTNNVWSEQGDIELSYHIPITNLLVKRQDVADVSGDWLTLYSQPITQASDMDFTFVDFTNQYGKTYKYALVPLLTQTQSGVEVEVEGGYTVSDEVQSIFDGVFIADSTGSQKCKANVGYGDVDMNQAVGTITPIGAKYPVVITNSKNQYHNGSITGTIVPDDYYSNGNLSRIDMVNKRNELEQFLTNKRAKIIKDWNSNIWLVMIMDNVTCTFNNEYGMGIVNFTANWIEVGDPTNQQDLQATGLIDVGGV